MLCHFRRTGLEESTDFILPLKQVNKKSLKVPCLCYNRNTLLKSGIKSAFYYLCGKLPDDFEWETLGFVDWIEVVADEFPKQSVSTGRAPAELTSEQEFSCDCIHGLLQAVLGLGSLIEHKRTVPPMNSF